MAHVRGARGNVSVVVITRDRCDELLCALDALCRLPEAPPIVVVDNGSSDDTIEGVRTRYPGVAVAATGRNMGAAGRNLGVAMTCTPYAAFADDDSGWEPGALAHAVELLDRHPRLALVAARVLVGDERIPDPACCAMARSPLPIAPDLPGKPVLGFLACGAVVRSRAFLQVGGFDERMEVGGEEQLLAWDLAAAGWGLSYVDAVTARHAPSPVRVHDRRRTRVLRNEMWSAWMRRRWTAALDRTARLGASALRDAVARRAFVEGMTRLPEILRDRRPLPRAIEHQVALLQASSSASVTAR